MSPVRASDVMNFERTIAAAIAAGLVAITVNIALLNACDAAGIVTARGGFQKLVKAKLAPILADLGLGRWWHHYGFPIHRRLSLWLGLRSRSPW
jgi:hypothetical protein